MNIKTKLLINIFLPVGIALVIVLTVISMMRHERKTEQENKGALSLLSGMSELNQRTYYYLLYGEERTMREWYSLYDSMSALANELHFDNREQNDLLLRIKRNFGEMRDLFARRTAAGNTPSYRGGAALQRDRQDRLSGQILIRARSIASDAFQLYRISSKKRSDHSAQANIMILLLISGSVLIAVGTLYPMNRNIAKSIARLSAGSEIVGSGNLDHRIGLQARDELGHLAGTFDAMADHLRAVTVSRDELAREIAERTRVEEALRRTEEIARTRLAEIQAIYATAPVGLCFVDTRLRYVSINKKLAEINGLSIEEHLGRTLREAVPELADMVEPYYRQVMETGTPLENIEISGRTRANHGEVRYWLAGYYPVSASSGALLGINTVVQDITERKRMEEELKHQAHHDPLTGLPNRKLFIDILEVELAQVRRDRRKAAVLFLDLDRFKTVNDTLGHDAGDRLLKEFARRLRHTVRESDTVSRRGGDEFNILLPHVARREDIIPITRKIIAASQEPYLINGHEFLITTSIGISVYPDDSRDIETLFRYADIALYRAKEHGRNMIQFYDPSMSISPSERIQGENSLRRSLERDELVLFYQPQASLDTRRVECVEALVRWRHPEQGLLVPVQFMPLAEETGLIVSIDTWVVRTACAQNKAWQDSGLPPVRVSVNLSALQFQQPDLVEKIHRTLRETGLSPEFLELEITENTAMRDIEHTVSSAHRLAELGITLSLDDFGTGCTSLGHLKRLPIRTVKIDKRFIQDMAADPDDRAVVHAVISMAHHFRIKVVAEGVENEEQLACLRSGRCDGIQGYLLSEPVSADRMHEILRKY